MVRVLMERDAQLASLWNEVPVAASGRTGRWVFLGGEAGVGKTTLVGALLARLGADGPVVRRGYCDNVATPSPLGPVLDAMPELGRAIEDTTPATRPRLFHDIRTLLAAGPTVLVLEDLHWADEATLELVRFLGRRLDGLPLLAVATFRDDETGPGDRLTGVLGDLATTAGVRRMHLPPLTLDAVTRLVSTDGSTVDPAVLHERTGGNPFFVTEVLAAGTSEAPDSVRDAVLARASRVPDAARDVLGAAAVLGPGTSLPLLAQVAGREADGVDDCVRRGLLVADPATGGLSFRHEIARETVEASLSPATRSRLHEAAYVALSALPVADHHRLAHHAAGCGRAHDAVRHAQEAAERSARLGAHQEAAHAYRLALLFADALDEPTLAVLHDGLSYECYLTDQLEAAIEERLVALDLHERSGNTESVGAAQRWLSRLSWFLGRGDDALRYGDLAVTTLEALPAGHELAMAWSNRAQLAMLAGDRDTTTRWARRAVELARTLGDVEVETHALNNWGTAETLDGETVDGLARLRHSLDVALAADLHEHAARAYTNLGAVVVQLRRFAEADRELASGIAYCAERDLDSWRLYMSAWKAASALHQGRLREADDLARGVLRDPGVAPVSRMPALIVAGTVAVRRGEDHATALLDEARDLASGSREAQRIVPAALARVEHAWTTGETERVLTELEAIEDLDPSALDAFVRGQVLWWRRTAGVADGAASDVPEALALMMSGDLPAAAAVWASEGSAWWQALSLALSPDLDDARAGVDSLAAMGAEGTRQALLRERHRQGLAVPRGPRRSTRDNPGGLTPRELEVLALLAEGLTNAELAGRLFLSEKTVDHHVSAVLRKLGEPTRARAVAAALGKGLLPNMGSSPDVTT